MSSLRIEYTRVTSTLPYPVILSAGEEAKLAEAAQYDSSFSLRGELDGVFGGFAVFLAGRDSGCSVGAQRDSEAGV
jgi:hypothetical protein